MFEKSNLLLALATRSRGYTDKTHLRGLKILDFLLVHGSGLCLCSSEFYSPNTFQTSSKGMSFTLIVIRLLAKVLIFALFFASLRLCVRQKNIYARGLFYCNLKQKSANIPCFL